MIQYLVENKKEDFLLQSQARERIRALVEKLEALVTAPEMRRRLAAQGRAWVLAERDWHRVSERILRVYEGLLEK